MNLTEFNGHQRASDKLHHEGRIAWLSAESPRWACGALVPKHEAANMLMKSRDALRLIVEHGMTTNSAQLCRRVMSDGGLCGLVAPCPDCGRACHDVPAGS